jgi:hypothetical protein
VFLETKENAQSKEEVRLYSAKNTATPQKKQRKKESKFLPFYFSKFSLVLRFQKTSADGSEIALRKR